MRCQPNFWNFCRYIYRMGDVGSDHDWFRYDEANRLVRASVKEDPTGQRTQQDYDYDAFGNITEVKTWPPGQSSQTTTIQVNANTNRLSAAGYDASGNMTSWGSDSYTYDTGNQMVKQNGRWYFLYTFSGERVATIDWQGSIATREVDWTIRGPSNQVLSTFKLTGEDQAGNWSREIDYIWMGRRLLGTEEDPGGPNATVKHYHTDHLGTIRLITDSAGNKVSEHEYLPYGQELTAAGDGVMKFTGHERDGDTGMDYMHARFYLEHLGRFMSVDPHRGFIGIPRSMNAYSYAWQHPIILVDPDGRTPACLAAGAVFGTIGIVADFVGWLGGKAGNDGLAIAMDGLSLSLYATAGVTATCGIASGVGGSMAIGSTLGVVMNAGDLIDRGSGDTGAVDSGERGDAPPEDPGPGADPGDEVDGDGGDDDGYDGTEDEGDCITCGFTFGGSRDKLAPLNADWPYELIEGTTRGGMPPGGGGRCRWEVRIKWDCGRMASVCTLTETPVVVCSW